MFPRIVGFLLLLTLLLHAHGGSAQSPSFDCTNAAELNARLGPTSRPALDTKLVAAGIADPKGWIGAELGAIPRLADYILVGSSSNNGMGEVAAIARGARIDGDTLVRMLPGTTIHGFYVGPLLGISWVEHYEASGRYCVRFDPGFPVEEGISVTSDEGFWSVVEDLLCYDSRSLSGCEQIYWNGSSIQFADAPNGEVFAVSTQIDWGGKGLPPE